MAERAGLPAVSVVIPTLGRPTLADCLRSLGACRPQPDEVVLVVQGPTGPVHEMVAASGLAGVRVVADGRRGVSSARNLGLRSARHATMLVTDDDCVVDPGWVGRGAELAARHPGAIVTGRVEPGGDPRRIPSCKTEAAPQDFTGTRHPGALYPSNMVLPRDSAVALGGFDERFGPDEAAEDGDFAYRWLTAGLPMRYEPGLVVRHNDWRSDEQLERLYVRYARGSGALYGKHLRRGDLRVLPFLLDDLRQGVRALVRGLRGRPRWSDPAQSTLRGLPGGLLFGLRRLG